MTDLRNLGLQFGGSRHPYRTTFKDGGLLLPTSPFRRAWAHIDPTFDGMVVASLRLLRDPHVIHALPGILAGNNRNLLDHLFEIYALNVAVVFGDTATADHAERVLVTVHRRNFPASGQPAWLTRQLGYRRDFTTGDARLQSAVMLAFTSAIARAHQAYGVLGDGAEGERYCRDAVVSLGRMAQIPLETPTLRELHRQGALYMRIPLMGSQTLAEADVPALLRALLSTELAPGVPLSTLAPRFAPLMWEADREALGITCTDADQRRFDTWATDYAERANRYSMAASTNGNVQFGEGEEVLTEDAFFTASNGRVSYS